MKQVVNLEAIGGALLDTVHGGQGFPITPQARYRLCKAGGHAIAACKKQLRLDQLHAQRGAD